ncbi:MAG: thioesterase domain-containing protein, partial [Pseudomonadales bacterium]
ITLTNLISWQLKEPVFREAGNIINFTETNFDVFMQEFFSCLSSGSSFIVPQASTKRDAVSLARYIVKNNIHKIFLPFIALTYLLEELTNNYNKIPLRYIITAGEQLSINQEIKNFFNKYSDAQLYNHYGPSEAHVVTSYTLSKDVNRWDYLPSIGAPISNTQIYILDQYNKPQPTGVPGELHIAGDGLARGYLNRLELTQEKFIPNPFDPGARMYKSGDLARWLADGNIEYLGRIDTQVKIRGFRIELGEIEAQLNQYPEIKHSVVVVQGKEVNKQLIAFYRAKDSREDNIINLLNEDLRAYLQQTLPEYMLPVAFVSLETIPLTPNGKVNRRVLEQMDVSVESSQAYLAPRNDTEKLLVEIWSQVLDLEPENIGVNDNFFDLGGHSLLAVQLMAKINKEFKQSLRLATLFTASNIAALAQLIISKKEVSFDILVPIQTKGNKPPIFAMPGAGGNVLSLQPLSYALGDKQPFYGLEAIGLDGKTSPLDSVEKTAKANITVLKSIQTTGPYRLIGYSYGAKVAYEMASLLLAQGESLHSVILLDTSAFSVQENVPDDVEILYNACDASAKYFNKEMKFTLAQLQQVPASQRIDHIINLLINDGIDASKEQFTAFYNVYKNNFICHINYTPQPLSEKVNIALYRSLEKEEVFKSLDHDYGWNQLLVNKISIYDVPGDHTSMVSIQHIEELAEKINHYYAGLVN